jgi:uncharacterized protein (TIGR02391 family)
MNSLPELVPDEKFLLEMEAEELGGVLLIVLAKQRQQSGVHQHNYFESLFSNNPSAPRYPDQQRNQIELAVAEAWNWLEVQGLLVTAPGINGANGWRVLSRRAERMSKVEDVQKFAKSRKIRRETLHPRIAQTVWSAFMRGEFDVAVFQAMKSVEVAVREAAGLSAGDVGTNLMRAAFHVETGKLTDFATEKSERQARSDLFAGAIGSYKNPHSHRDVNIDEADEAIEIVHLANHLLRIVDQRKLVGS